MQQLQIQDIKRSLFLNLITIASYTGAIAVYLNLYTIFLFYINFAPIFILVNFILFFIELKKDKFMLPIPEKYTNNIIFSIYFYIGLLLGFNTLFVYHIHIINMFNK
jgi:succinate-acetate transporter protein